MRTRFPTGRSMTVTALVLTLAFTVQACRNQSGETAQTEQDQTPVKSASNNPLSGDMPAFRSVLDGKSRILTVRMGNAVYLAYDAEQGHLHQGWSGDVDFSGAVYDYRHGPQPQSEGALFFISDEPRWQVEGAEAQLQYRGHQFSGDKTQLLYKLTANGWSANVVETPRAELQGAGLTVQRRFQVEGLPEGITLALVPAAGADTQQVSGSGRWADHRLELANGETELRLDYASGEAIDREDPESQSRHPGVVLIENDDCAACHNEEMRTVGPSYQSIAERYADDDSAPEYLAQQIIEGGSGNWGQAAMTAHPNLSEQEALQMADYILGLYQPSEEESDVVEEEAPASLEQRESRMPGDRAEVAGVHPAFDLHQARPDDFEPKVGGIDFMPDGRMVVSTWDPEGSVYIVSNYTADNPDNISVRRIARGLAEPLGLTVVDGDIYVMQKQELTRLVDLNGDGLIDQHLTVANDWSVTDNFHEFAFGLEYADGYFYGTLATAILPGGASADPQAPDRGTLMKISRADGSVETVAHGLRTPNGIGRGVDGELFIADNEGDWLPSSKIVEVTEGAWYGSRSVDFEGTADLQETLPVVWLPQDEIGNSPSEPAPLNVGPYQNQMIHGEVTHGGIKRVYAERVDGRLQGAVFRFTQGLEAGINRLDWAPDGSLIAGGVGAPGNWSHDGKEFHGLQRLVYNGETAFEMLSVSARSDGFVVEFTEAIGEDQPVSAEYFDVQQWYYQPTEEYGGPKKDWRRLSVSDFALSEDRTRAYFQLEGMKPGHLVYFRIHEPFTSASGSDLWTTEAWYTLNAIPDTPLSLPR